MWHRMMTMMRRGIGTIVPRELEGCWGGALAAAGGRGNGGEEPNLLDLGPLSAWASIHHLRTMKNRVDNQVHLHPIPLSTNCSNTSVLYLTNPNRWWICRLRCKRSTPLSRTQSFFRVKGDFAREYRYLADMVSDRQIQFSIFYPTSPDSPSMSTTEHYPVF